MKQNLTPVTGKEPQMTVATKPRRAGRVRCEKHERKLWLARRRTDGDATGYLVTEGGIFIAFVRSIDAMGLRVAKQITASPCLLDDADELENLWCQGVIVNDFRKLTLCGPYVDSPAHLYTTVFFPVDDAGKIVPLPDKMDFATISNVSEQGRVSCRFELYRAVDKAELPAWMREPKEKSNVPGKATTRTLASNWSDELCVQPAA